MAGKSKARRDAPEKVGKKGGPASTSRAERGRKGASKSGAGPKTVPKVGKKETGRTDGSGGLH